MCVTVCTCTCVCIHCTCRCVHSVHACVLHVAVQHISNILLWCTCTVWYIMWSIMYLKQLKNMVNALYSSRVSGTKEFQLEGNTFGWQSIVELYSRECERRNKSAARSVPRLREVHVIRDSWTKLNVHPAKIMQVNSLHASYCCIYCRP